MFRPTSWLLQLLPKCFTTKQCTVKASHLFDNKNPLNSITLLSIFKINFTCLLLYSSRVFKSFGNLLINKQRSLDCALFCCKAHRKRLELERSVGRNTRRSRMFRPTSWLLQLLPKCFTTKQCTVKASHLFDNKNPLNSITLLSIFKINFTCLLLYSSRSNPFLQQVTSFLWIQFNAYDRRGYFVRSKFSNTRSWFG